jgi:hypothetical protein
MKRRFVFGYQLDDTTLHPKARLFYLLEADFDTCFFTVIEINGGMLA